MRFGAFFWAWLARRVFSPNPHATLFCSFFVSGHTHTDTENGSLGEQKRQLQGGEREKRGRAVCSTEPGPCEYIWPFYLYLIFSPLPGEESSFGDGGASDDSEGGGGADDESGQVLLDLGKYVLTTEGHPLLRRSQAGENNLVEL